MATKNWSLDDGLQQFLNQIWSSGALGANQLPSGDPIAWAKDIPGINLSSGNWGQTNSINDPANLAALKNYGPQNIAQKMGWQYDPATQQFTAPFEEDNFFGDFMEFAEVPMIFGGLMAGAGALNGAFGGAAGGGSFMGAGVDPVIAADAAAGTPMFGGGGGLTASLTEYASPNNFAGWSSDSPTVGNESDWWSTVPQGTAEAAAGGVGSAAASGGGLMDSIGNFLKGVTPGQWLNVGGQALGAGLGYLGSQAAANAQQQAASDQQGLLKYMYDQNRADLAPWRQAGVGALGNLVNLTTPGKQFDQMALDPGYQFRLSQGEQGINRAAASRGGYDSGGTLKALQRFGQDYASNEFGNVYNRNANLAGLGQTAVGQGVQAGQNYAQNAGESMLQAGNARASGYMGGANAISQGIGGALNAYNQYTLLDKLLAGKV